MATYTSRYPTLDEAHIGVTSQHSSAYNVCNAFDPSKSTNGNAYNNSWKSIALAHFYQRINVDLSAPYIIRRVEYINYHDYGEDYNCGARDIKVYASNSNVMFLQYGNYEGLTELTLDIYEMAMHVNSNTEDVHYILLDNDVLYQFYVIEIVTNWKGNSGTGIRRIKLQTEDGYEPISSSSSSSSIDD